MEALVLNLFNKIEFFSICSNLLPPLDLLKFDMNSDLIKTLELNNLLKEKQRNTCSERFHEMKANVGNWEDKEARLYYSSLFTCTRFRLAQYKNGVPLTYLKADE